MEDDRTDLSFVIFLTHCSREASLKAVLEPCELSRSLQLCLHGPHEEITHSFVIVEDAPSLLKQSRTYAT